MNNFNVILSEQIRKLGEFLIKNADNIVAEPALIEKIEFDILINRNSYDPVVKTSKVYELSLNNTQ